MQSFAAASLLFSLIAAPATPPEKLSTERRFAVRAYVSGDRTVGVSAASDLLVVRTVSPELTGDVVAALTERVAFALAERWTGREAVQPMVLRSAKRLAPHGLFLVELAQPLPRAFLVALADALAVEPGVLQVYPALTRATGRAFADDHLIVTARRGQLRELLPQVLALTGGTLVREATVPDTALVRVGEAFARDAVHASAWLTREADLRGRLAAAEPNLYREMALRAFVNDPLATDQWHLFRSESSVPGTGQVYADAAWDVTFGDPSVVVAIADTGMDIHHADLVANLVPGFDAAANDDDPMAECSAYDDTLEDPSCPSGAPYREAHATSVAGVAAGVGNNGLGTTGACPACAIMPIRLLGNYGDDPLASLSAAEAFHRAVDAGAAVINNSWGPAMSRYFPLSLVEREALRYARLEGRGGLGTVVLFAAGNDTADVSSDPYARDHNVVTVAGTTNLDDWAYYSNYGAEIDVAAPTVGGAVDEDNHGIVTADVSAGGGYDVSDYTSEFGGTSSSSPLVAGIAGLILSANADLTADQVRILLTSTADKIRADKVDWQAVFDEDIEALFAYDETGHSIGFGYGRVNAGAAVNAALAPPLQGALCSATGCPSCDDEGRCRQACAVQGDCPDGSLCEAGACVAPRPAANTVGEPCTPECDYCLPGLDSDYMAISLCTRECAAAEDCPGGFVCRQLDPGAPRLCVWGKETAGYPNDGRACFDDLTFARVLVTSGDQILCSDICIEGLTDICPAHFHCGFARCTCTATAFGDWCFEYTCSESTLAQANWTFDLCFPDEGFAVTCATDDECKRGDYCAADGTCRIDDREGCSVCAPCETSADCGLRGNCRDLDDGLGPRCLIACDGDGSCPGDSVCGEVQTHFIASPTCLPRTADGSTPTACRADYACQTPCRDDVPCPDGQICTLLGECVTPPPPPKKKEKDGCSAVGGAAWPVVLIGLLAGRRRRASPRG